MSLFRKLVFSVSLLVALLLLGSLLVTVHNARAYFAHQLETLAQDTATFLGLAVGRAAERGDQRQLDAMINAIFERGYYRGIIYRNAAGEDVVSRLRTMDVDGVPSWFVDWVSIPERSGSADVASGLQRLGRLYVTVHPGYAYHEMWRVFTESLWLFSMAAVICYGLVGLGLKQLLKPLRKIESQADAICRQEFPLQEALPKTPELRRAVIAMNRMVQKIQLMFSQQLTLTDNLRREVYLDPLTGLPNRKEFDVRTETWVASEDGGSPGVLALLQLGDLVVLNDRYGRETGDQLLKEVASMVSESLVAWPHSLCARRTGSDFSLFVPGMLQEEVGSWLSDLKTRIESSAMMVSLDSPNIWLGAATSRSVVSVSKMLSAADAALRLARSGGRSDWAVYPVDDPLTDIRPAGEWQDYLRQLIDRNDLLLYYQPVFDISGTAIGAEVFSRARDGDDVVQAGVFWPLAERFGLALELDQLAVTAAIDMLAAHPGLQLSVNLTTATVINPAFTVWLQAVLKARPEDVSRLTLEIHESALGVEGWSALEFYTQLEQCGTRLAVDHFGITPSALGQLQQLPLAYVKVDRRFVSQVDRHPENRFYLHSLVQIARGCELAVFAEGVETEAEWLALKSLGFDGGQGYFLARPDKHV